jgi:hypothetical protein
MKHLAKLRVTNMHRESKASGAAPNAKIGVSAIGDHGAVGAVPLTRGSVRSGIHGRLFP